MAFLRPSQPATAFHHGLSRDRAADEGQAYNTAVGQRQCYHCKQWIAEDEPHDCWTTTEAALTRDLAPDLLEAWERLRETASEFGVQRIYA